jgi:replicative DNA helicase
MPSHKSGPRRAHNAAGAEVDAGQADHHEGTPRVRYGDGFAPDPDPTSTEAAEAALIGAMLLRPDARDGALGMVTAGDFDREAHRTVFETVVAMHAAGEHVDNVSVNDRLATTGQLEVVGTLAAVWALTSLEGCPTPAAWPVYATIVAREGRRRRGIRLLQRAIDRLEAGEDPALVSAELAVAA